MPNKEIRVLHVGLSSNLGGIENVVRSWNSMLPSNIKFDFINNGHEPIAFQNEFEENGATVYKIPSRKENPFVANSLLKKIIYENEYDYVQHHMMSFSWPQPLLIAQKSKKTKAIAHSHTAGSRNLSWKYRALDVYGRYRLEKNPYYKLACGEKAGTDMFHTNDFVVMQNGVDFSKCVFNKEKRSEIRKQYNISEETYVVGHVGRSGNAKNYPFIIDLFSDLVSQKPDSVLLLIGNVREDEMVRDYIRAKGVEDKVTFTGVLSDLNGYYSAMDVFILPSLYEGVSVAMIEAQVSGLECIVSKFVSKDADISGKVRYISVSNTTEGVKELLGVRKQDRSYDNLNINCAYDLKNTANKMFSFYEDHLYDA